MLGRAADAVVEELHDLAREPLRLGPAVGRRRIGAERREVVEDVEAVFAAHDGDDNGGAGGDGEERAAMGDVRGAVQEGHFDVRLRHAQVGEDREAPPRPEHVEDVAHDGGAPALHHVDAAVLALHPGVDVGVALTGGDGGEGNAVLGHRPGGHVPVAAVGHHDDGAPAFGEDVAEARGVEVDVLHVARNPCLGEAGGADHLDGVQEDVRERADGDGARAGARDAGETALDAGEGACALEAARDGKGGEAARAEARDGVGDRVDEAADGAEGGVLGKAGGLRLLRHPSAPLSGPVPERRAGRR